MTLVDDERLLAAEDEEAQGGVSGSFWASVQQRATAGIEERRRKIDDLQAQTKELRLVEELAERVQTELEADHAGAALQLLSSKRGASARDLLAQRDASAAAMFDAHREELEEEVDKRLSEIARTFPAELQRAGVVPDAASRAPKFTFDGSFIEVVFDRKKRLASLETRHGKKDRLAPDPDVVAQRVLEIRKRLFGRSTDLERFAATLREAVSDAATDDGSVPIMRVVDRLRERDKAFKLDEFIVDLSALVTSGAQNVREARGLKLEHTKNEEEGLLLPGLEDRGYYGYMHF